MYLNDHACFAKKMNATLKTNVSLYWRFETLKILNAAIFNKYFTCKIYIDVLKERFTHEKIVHCLGTDDKIHCNKAEVKPFCCSDGKGGVSLQILDVIRKIKRVFVLLAGHKSPSPSFTDLAHSLFSDWKDIIIIRRHFVIFPLSTLIAKQSKLKIIKLANLKKSNIRHI